MGLPNESNCAAWSREGSYSDTTEDTYDCDAGQRQLIRRETVARRPWYES